MFPENVDISLLVPDKDRPHHWHYPPTGDCFHDADFTEIYRSLHPEAIVQIEQVQEQHTTEMQAAGYVESEVILSDKVYQTVDGKSAVEVKGPHNTIRYRELKPDGSHGKFVSAKDLIPENADAQTV